MKTLYDHRLLPCPFCGEDAIIGYFPAEERLGAKDAFYVGCSNDHCGCELEHQGGYKTLEEAIEKWNRRQKSLEKEPILDKIKGQIEDYLHGVEIALEVLVENDPLRPKMEGAKDTLEECLELIDKAEKEHE